MKRYSVLVLAVFLLLSMVTGCKSYDEPEVLNTEPPVADVNSGAVSDSTTVVASSIYLNVHERTSLLLVKPVSVLGKYSKSVWHYREGQAYDRTFDEFLIIQAEVVKDFYDHQAAGNLIYVAFPCYFKVSKGIGMGWTDALMGSVDVIEAILKCDQMAFYSIMNRTSFFEGWDGGAAGREQFTEDIYICNYNDNDSVIPFVDGVVDYTVFQTLLDKYQIERHIDEYFENILLSGYSILPGDSTDEALQTIEKLVELNIYGG